jgi:hypothetical protein
LNGLVKVTVDVVMADRLRVAAGLDGEGRNRDGGRERKRYDDRSFHFMPLSVRLSWG